MRRLCVLLLLLAGLARAAEDTVRFADEGQRLRYQRFVAELRCPKCQNQNLADSDAPIAADLRRELVRLLREGRSDTEIVDFMVARYGEYILYKPPLEPRTWLLWGGPAVLLAGGLVLVVLMVRRSRVRAAAAPLSAAERDRLRRLLDDGEGGA